VIQICKNCGAVNSQAAERCCFCDELFVQEEASRPAPAARSASAGAASGRSLPVEGNLAVEIQNLRHEVAGRVEAYRERRRQLLPGDPQTDFLFRKHEEEYPDQEEDLEEPDARPPRGPLLSPESASPLTYRSLPSPRPRARGVERLEIAVFQPELDFGIQEQRPRAVLGQEDKLVPVATLRERRRAGLLDALFLLLACGAFLGVFAGFGGHLIAGKLDAVVIATMLALFYAQYFALFTIFGGETPGMMLGKLRVVAFDGSDPTSHQLRWRSFGYLVSGGTAFLGFLWALWDEDNLTWQDRISQTYITSAPQADQPHT